MKMWAALFPGQGSQSVGMGRFFFDSFLVARNLFEEASDLLSLDIKKLCYSESEENLLKTENAQVCLLTVSVIAYTISAKEFDFTPSFSAGHSVGEYAALVSSGVLPFQEALSLVRQRGKFMEKAQPLGKGGMLALQGLNQEEVIQLCHWAEEESKLKPIQPAAFNAPFQTVVSGSKELIDWIQKNNQKFFNSSYFNSKSNGLEKREDKERRMRRLRMIPLKVSAPFHSSLMKPAEEKMKSLLNEISFLDAKKPIIQNTTAKPVVRAKDLKENIVPQITQPVRWIESMNYLISQGITHYVELGNGKILSSLFKKIDTKEKKLNLFNTNTLNDFKEFEKIWSNNT